MYDYNAMLDLVKAETERIESRFLEPACGTGNFLVEILRRKLDVVEKQYGTHPSDYEKFSILALSSIYGIELLRDNVDTCRERLYQIWDKAYTSVCKETASNQCRDAARYILDLNIICGNTLEMKKDDGTPIVFAQWELVADTQLKRSDFRMDDLIAGHERQMSLDMGEWEYDAETDAMVPKPVREYPPMDYWSVQEAVDFCPDQAPGPTMQL